MKKMYVLLIVSSFLAITQSQAQIIFKESFDYPVGNLEGKNGGTGFSTMWSQTGTDATTAGAATLTQIVAGSINSTLGVGNRVQATLENNKTIRIDRTIAASTLNVDAQDYWLSFWYRSTTTHDNTTYGVAAQIVLMNGENNTTATDMRLGFGKTSNFTGGSGVNSMTAFTRANASCAAANWPTTAALATTLNVSSQGTYYVLVKISRREFVDLNTATLPATTLGTFDGVRVWFLTQPPSGAGDAIFTSKPAGDITTIDPNTGATLPILARVLRGGADNTVYNTACKKDGITGIRIRLEGNSGTTPFNVEFDELTLSTTLSALLPATFNSVSAIENGTTNNLFFATSNEVNAKEYQIENSSNGISFQYIGSITAHNANGLHKYNFVDVAPYNNTYYRIKLVDKDGSAQFSTVVSVLRKGTMQVSIAPNPVSNNVNIRVSGSIGNADNSYTITNANGKRMANGKFSGSSGTINVNNLAKGVYIIQVTQPNKQQTFHRIIKN